MIGSGELVVILGVSLLLFGGKKLPEFARNLGKGIREFRKACYESEVEEVPIEIPSAEENKPQPPQDDSNRL